MKLNKRILTIILLILFIFLRLMLFNVNKTEIGDSYNLITAAESLKHGTYPIEEKRMPLYPLLLSVGILKVEPVFWGRFLSLLLSLGILYLSFRIGEKLGLQKSFLLLIPLLIAINPIFSYWSLRVMSDLLFLLIIELVIYSLLILNKNSVIFALFMGFLGGLAILTRFEGGLLVLLVMITMYRRTRSLKWSLIAGTASFLTILPWLYRNYLLFHNPFHTAYTQEAKGYLPDLRSLGSFGIYALFLLGPLTPVFLLEGLKSAWDEKTKGWLPLLLSGVLFYPVICYWTAALPRLFLFVLPLTSILVVKGFERFEVRSHWNSMMLCFLVWGLGVFLLPSEFLRGSMGGFILIGFVTGLCLVLMKFRFPKLSLLLTLIILIFSQLVTSISVIARARNRSETTLKAALFAKDLPGPVGFSDETGVSSWYLSHNGKYWNGDTGFLETMYWFNDEKIKYVLVTNEHDEEGAQFYVVTDWEEKHHFKKLVEFSRTVPIDPFNRIFNKILGRNNPTSVIKHSEVYEVLSYKPRNPQ